MANSDIHDELQSHILDLVDEYTAQGLSPMEARQKAHKEFGDMRTIEESVKHIQGPHRLLGEKLFTLSIAVYIATTALTILLARTFSSSPIGIEIGPIALGFVMCGIVGVHLYSVERIIRFYGLRTPHVLATITAWTLLAHSAITIVLDIDKFEGILHALIVMGIFFGVTALTWRRLSLFWKKTLPYAVSGVIIFAALQEHRLLDFLGTMRCLFITPDAVPLEGALRSCAQVPFWDYLLWPIYISVIISFGVYGAYVKRSIFAQQTQTLHKIFVLLASCSIVVIPAMWRDVNNSGAVNIIPWQRAIYQEYQNALGRRPEKKDITFYAETRAYTQMERISAVLYASSERTLKIRLLYQEILQREPTTEELDRFIHNRTPVADIATELRASLTK